MTSPVHSGAAWRQIRRLFGLGTLSGLSEWQLLNRYADRRDEEAFEALVARHGSMVLGVCRRVLDDPEDVEDAFQATFLVLVRKARALRPNDPVGHWLYGVAHRVALRARSQARRRRSRERPVEAVGEMILADEGTGPSRDFDLRPVLDDEIRRLPETYRAAIVLCYLEGRTHEEAARQLGWPVGTVKGRLARARDLLRGRLTRRGVTLSTGGLGMLLGREAAASVPAGWVETAVRAAMRCSAGEVTTGVVPASATVLAEGVLWTMTFNHLKTAAAAFAVLATVAVGAVAYARQEGRDGPLAADIPKESAKAEAPKHDPAPVAATEESAGPGAPGPLAARGAAGTRVPNPVASLGYQLAVKDYMAGKAKAETVYLWSRRLAEQEAGSPDPGGRARAAEGHRKRMTQLEHIAHQNPSTANTLDDLDARYYREEAEKFAKADGTENLGRAGRGDLARDVAEKLAKAGGTENLGAAGSKGTSPVPGQDPRSLAILKKLDEPVAMSFPNETPLEDVLKYIKSSTTSSEFPNGFAIYVDPAGLQSAEKTMTSPVTIDLDGVPLRRTLYLVLNQLGLSYRVEDGMVFITAEDAMDSGPLSPSIAKPSPLEVMQGRAQQGEMSPEERKAFIEMLKDLNEIHALIEGKGGATGPGPGWPKGAVQ